MKAIYKGKIVKVINLITSEVEFLKYPMIIKVKIQWKENGEKWDDYVNVNEVEFID